MICDQAHRCSRGSSLVELVIATGVLGLVFLGISEVMGIQHPFALSSMSEAALQVRSSMVGDAMTRELARANPGNPTLDGTSLTYQVPVDPDGDGFLLDAQGNVQWGMTLNGVDTVGGTATLVYVVDAVLDENALDVDLNGDGDQNDFVDRGHLERQLSNGQSFRVSGSWILQPSGNHGGDLDGDLLPDPIFRVTNSGQGKLLRIDLNSASPLNSSEWTTLRNRSTVALRNSD